MPSPKVIPIRAALSLAAMIDRYGELKRQVDLVAPAEQEMKVLKELIEADCGGAAELPIVERGQVYEIQMSPKRSERTLTNKKKVFAMLKKTLGMDGVIALLDIPFTAAVDKYIPVSQQAGLVNKELSGYRTFTVVAIAAAEPPAAACAS
jgi:hypothetical protein